MDTQTAFEILQEATKPAAYGYRYKKIDDLAIGVPFAIDAFRWIDTQYGERLAALVDRCLYVLPARFSKNMSAEKVNELNCSKYSMSYHGRLNHKVAIIHFNIVSAAPEKNSPDAEGIDTVDGM